jgi:hypothetical protein
VVTVTWNNQPQYFTDYEVRITPPVTTTIPVDFDVTNIVSQWANGNWNNRGVILRIVDLTFPDFEEGDKYRTTVFESLEVYSQSSRRPQLYVEYQ